MEPPKMYNKVRYEIECYLKLAFPDQHLQLVANKALESFIDHWEPSYYKAHEELTTSNYNSNQDINESEQKYNYRNIALCKVFNSISDTFKINNSYNQDLK